MKVNWGPLLTNAIMLLGTAAGVGVTPDQAEVVIAIGGGLLGLINALLKPIFQRA